MYEERFMRRAIALSREALRIPGTKPFAAVIVRDGDIIGEGLNHSVAIPIRPRMARSRRSAMRAAA